MNPCSHLVNGPCGCAEAVAAREVVRRAEEAHAKEGYGTGGGFTAYGLTDGGVRATVHDYGETMTMRKARCEKAELEARERALGLGQQAETYDPEYVGMQWSCECGAFGKGSKVPLGHQCLHTLAALRKTQAGAPILSGYSPDGAHRLFTRQEVLTVLKAERTQTFATADSAFLSLMTIFERME